MNTPRGPSPVPVSVTSLRNWHQKLPYALNKLGNERSKLFHSSSPMCITAMEKALAPVKAQWREYRRLFKAELRRFHRESFTEAVSSINPRLDPSATLKIWCLINSFCSKQTVSTPSPDSEQLSTSPTVTSDEQLSSTAQFWSGIWAAVSSERPSSSAPKRNELPATNEMIRRLPFREVQPARSRD